MPRLVQGFDGLFHRRNRRRHQCRQADQSDLLFDGDLHNALDGHITAEIDDLVAIVLKDDLYDILADVVDIPLLRLMEEL